MNYQYVINLDNFWSIEITIQLAKMIQYTYLPLCFWKDASPGGGGGGRGGVKKSESCCANTSITLEKTKYKHQTKVSFFKSSYCYLFLLKRSFYYMFFMTPKVNCIVTCCSVSTYKIDKWKKETWTEHSPKAEGNYYKKKRDCLECKPSFHLHTFPGTNRRNVRN